MTSRTVRETVGFLGVIASLVFVGLEIRQNTRVARAEAYRSVAEVEAEGTLALVTNEQLAGVMRRVQLEGALRDDLTDSEKYQIGSMYDFRISNLQLIYRHVQEGILPERALNPAGNLSILFSAPYMREVWPIIREQYDADVLEYFEDRYGLAP